MPKTGPASVLIKEVMGLFLLAAAVYFVGTGLSGMLVSPPDPPSRLYWWPVMGLCAAAGGWMAWRTVRITSSLARRTIFGALGLVLVAASFFGAAGLTGKGPIHWVYYTEERFKAALADDKIVVMDFTAEWCLNCKALEHSVLYSDRVAKLMNAENVVPMKVDITGNNPEGKRKLADVNSLTIPLLVIFDSHGNQVFRSDAYTIDNVVEAISKAK
jgi:thiol:disulfide interchange protein DsbD